MAEINAPELGTEAYRWWSQGAKDEHAVADEGLSGDAIELRDLLTGLARLHNLDSAQELICSMAWIMWCALSWHQRLDLARRSLVRKEDLTRLLRKWERKLRVLAFNQTK